MRRNPRPRDAGFAVALLFVLTIVANLALLAGAVAVVVIVLRALGVIG